MVGVLLIPSSLTSSRLRSICTSSGFLSVGFPVSYRSHFEFAIPYGTPYYFGLVAVFKSVKPLIGEYSSTQIEGRVRGIKRMPFDKCHEPP